MENYIMTGIRIHRVDNTNSNRIEEPEDDFYITFEAINKDNPFEEPISEAIMGSNNPFMIRTFRKLFPDGKDKEGNDWNGLDESMTPEQVAAFDPDELPKAVRMLPPTTKIVRVPMPGLFLMKYNNNVVDKDGTPIPGKKKGQWVKQRNGLVKIYQSRKMLVVYKKDEDTGELTPADGWNPTERIKDYCERNCFPISQLRKNLEDPEAVIDEAYDPGKMADVKHPSATDKAVKEVEQTGSAEAEGMA